MSFARSTAFSGMIIGLCAGFLLQLYSLASPNFFILDLILGAIVGLILFAVVGAVVGRNEAIIPPASEVTTTVVVSAPPVYAPYPSYPAYAPPPAPAATAPSGEGPVKTTPTWEPVPLTVYEEPDETRVFAVVQASKVERDKLLIFTREAPDQLVSRFGLQGASVHKITRVEGEDNVAPGDVDRIGYLIEAHFSKGPNRSVVLPGLETLVDASSIKNIRRLLEVARDLAQSSNGTILTSVDNKVLPPSQVALLEQGAVKMSSQ